MMTSSWENGSVLLLVRFLVQSFQLCSIVVSRKFTSVRHTDRQSDISRDGVNIVIRGENVPCCSVWFPVEYVTNINENGIKAYDVNGVLLN